ncbi:DUF4180 domain-containing protein [Brumimicrobium mesophilum]|uniref:DUF4180 domain-containing protein n=1 Tax=Brumimicrobium mesophilum TaxID=392717 RepID=UPI000D144BE5|nr:DUF4180 domain-containing protein [Brumimicrobium mesophilum]
MEIKEHSHNEVKIAEVISDKILINCIEDALDLIGNIYYQGFDRMLLHEKNISPDFFDLKTKLAGDVLQKFTQYRMPLTIIGDFSNYSSNSLKDFIFESNKGKQVNFQFSVDEALKNV